MKLHPLLLGRTKVPYGQFYGGLAGWEGLRALFRLVTRQASFHVGSSTTTVSEPRRCTDR